MKLTSNDIDFFKHLSRSETGRYLADYCKRVLDYNYDSRSWASGTTKESAAQAGKVIEELLLDKLRTSTKGEAVLNQFES